MKIIVKFTDDVSGEWIDDILKFQKIKGCINVIKIGKRYLVDEIGIPKYGIDKDWIERIIEE
jgi:hypothetical protein